MRTLKIILLILAVFLCSTAFCYDPFCFEEAGTKYNINPNLLWAISKVESNHNNEAINWNKNGSYDYCHMQINSGWYKTIGHEKWMSIADPCACTMVGAEILKKCIARYDYTWEAIGCYNAVSKNKRVAYTHKINNALQKINYVTYR